MFESDFPGVVQGPLVLDERPNRNGVLCGGEVREGVVREGYSSRWSGVFLARFGRRQRVLFRSQRKGTRDCCPTRVQVGVRQHVPKSRTARCEPGSGGGTTLCSFESAFVLYWRVTSNCQRLVRPDVVVRKAWESLEACFRNPLWKIPKRQNCQRPQHCHLSERSQRFVIVCPVSVVDFFRHRKERRPIVKNGS